MHSTEPFELHLNDPAEVLALVPYLLGFTPDPTTALVLIALTDNQILAIGHLGLPTAGEPLGPLSAAVRRTAVTLARHGGTDTILIGYGVADRVDAAVTVASTTLHEAGIGVRRALRVTDGRFFSLDCADPTCCPPAGTPFDPNGTVAAATAVMAGMVALRDRQAVADTIAPVTGPARHAMVMATIAACQRMQDLLDTATAGHAATGADQTVWDSPVGREISAAARTELADAWASYRAGRPIDDEHAALLTVLLDVPGVRGYAARHGGGEPWQIAMWSDLVRRAEPPFTPAAACLLALAALQAGNGTLADAAVRRALAADPTAWPGRCGRPSPTASIQPPSPPCWPAEAPPEAVGPGDRHPATPEPAGRDHPKTPNRRRPIVARSTIRDALRDMRRLYPVDAGRLTGIRVYHGFLSRPEQVAGRHPAAMAGPAADRDHRPRRRRHHPRDARVPGAVRPGRRRGAHRHRAGDAARPAAVGQPGQTPGRRRG
jgi:Domain of unknown function (DUF4192)